jgi:putative ABC transport system ATP-binding protein
MTGVEGPPAIELDDVVVTRFGRRVLDRLYASIAGGRITAVTGPSGSGKTTLLRLINRLAVPESGVVRYRGTDVAELDPLALRRRVGMVFQRPTAFPGTVRDNLAEAAPDTDGSYAAALSQAALDPSMIERDTAQLSGGELQRVCLARTLVTEPEALLLDEPTSNLDDRAAELFEAAARSLVATGTTIVWVTHNRAQLDRVADDVLELRRRT